MTRRSNILLIGFLQLVSICSIAQTSLFGVPTPSDPVNNDGSSITVGVKFKSNKPIVIQAIRFYKGTADGSIYTLKLYKASNSQVVDSVNYQQLGSSGWVSKNFARPVSLQKDTIYIAAVYSAAGNYASSPNFYGVDITTGFLTAIAGSTQSPNGLYRYGNGVPNEGFQNSNYWVDIIAHDSASFAQGATNSGWQNIGNVLSNSNNGLVGVNTLTNPAPTDSTIKMAVNGTLYAKKIKVVATGWADYVFDSTYQLISLDELREFIKSEKHLPEIPSTNEILKNDIDVAETQILLLKKIEELTLYILQQENKLKQQQEAIDNLKRKMTNL